MKILVVGASGMVGSRIVAEAIDRGHSIIAASRHPEKISTSAKVEAVKVDANDAASIAAAAKTADVIVMSVSPRNGGDPVAEATAFGKAAMDAAKISGKRLVFVGGAGSLLTPDGQPVAESLPDAYRGEALGMRAVRDSLLKSDLDWTFLCPAMMIAPGERSGKFRLGKDTMLLDANGESKISAEDYAVALVDEIETPAHRRQQFAVAY